MTAARMTNRIFGASLLAAGLILSPATVAGQVTWQDLVFTGGLSVEGYRGNLQTVNVPAADSAGDVSASVGEVGVRGGLVFLNDPGRTLSLQVDAGLRQFVASGFSAQSGDYAPREWVGRMDLSFRRRLEALGDLWVEAGAAGRRVDDRPPMPLFIQAGHATVDGRVRLQLLPVKDVYYDALLFAEKADYTSNTLTPQLNLLDREALGAEVGATWAPGWFLRGYLGFRATSYGNQETYDPRDPHRRDKTLSVGATWTLRSSFYAEVGLEGILNRSNSDRPEYNAVSLRGVLSAPLPRDFSVNLYAVLTAKSYVTETDFARLVPGEEADNASVVYLELARPILANLTGAMRLGWNRAETDIGDAYYERFGGTFLLRYRPWQR